MQDFYLFEFKDIRLDIKTTYVGSYYILDEYNKLKINIILY